MSVTAERLEQQPEAARGSASSIPTSTLHEVAA